MNTKRQTIWLVSMLSLMVILSAYYLFTEDIGTSPEVLTETSAENGAAPDDAAEVAGNSGNEVSGIVADEVVTGNADSEGDAPVMSKEEQDILNEVESQAVAGGIFNEIEHKRTKQLMDEQNKLYGVLADTKQEPEKTTEAVAQLDQLEAENDQIASVEKELEKQYRQAIVSAEANDKYKVVVQSDKMEKAEAESIVRMVMGELDLTADQVSVQVVQ